MFGRGDRENREKVESSHEPHAFQTDMTKACKLPYSSPDSPDLNGQSHPVSHSTVALGAYASRGLLLQSGSDGQAGK